MTTSLDLVDGKVQISKYTLKMMMFDRIDPKPLRFNLRIAS